MNIVFPIIITACMLVILSQIIGRIKRRKREEMDEEEEWKEKWKLFNNLKKTKKGNDIIMTDTTKPYVVVRTFSAGVHAGFLVKREGMEVTLENSRRIRYWDGAFTLSELAHVGPTKPDKCEFSIELPSILLLEAIEIIPTTPEAEKIIREIAPYVPPSMKEDD